MRFDHLVADETYNPMGLDFIVYGNAFWVGGDPQRRWAEPAYVEIMLDVDDDVADRHALPVFDRDANRARNGTACDKQQADRGHLSRRR